MSQACSSCLGRSQLIGELAPAIDTALERRPALGAEVLGLDDSALRSAFGSVQESRGMERATVTGVEAVCRHSKRFPQALLELEARGLDTPAAIFVAGGLDRLENVLDGPAVTIVGGRKASGYALDTAYGLGRSLAAAGITVISGLALGVDAAAHRGALDGGGSPLAVVASGADVAYPRTNRALRDRVVEEGVVISEMPPGSPAFRWAFPARNRIMAALGAMTIVVECRARSGSLITVRCAEKLQRVVGAVPGRIDSRLAEGSNGLIREGVQVITGASAVLDELFGVEMGPDGPRGAAIELDPTLGEVLDLAVAGSSPSAIGAELDLAPGRVRAMLGELELRGLIARDRLGGWSLRQQ
ncbi:MAG: processing protein [Thermoleophilaceae bacterium]|nr:processing protein [Thermoleophilaceae bacterium]